MRFRDWPEGHTTLRARFAASGEAVSRALRHLCAWPGYLGLAIIGTDFVRGETPASGSGSEAQLTVLSNIPRFEEALVKAGGVLV